MSHAFNGVTGTFMPGEYDGGERAPASDFGLVNVERQAVGLPSSHRNSTGNGRVTAQPVPADRDGIREMGRLRPTQQRMSRLRAPQLGALA